MGEIGKLFKDGDSQAVRIPDRFRFEGTEVEFRPGPNPGEVILAPKDDPVEAHEAHPEATSAGILDTRNSGWDEFFRLRALIPPEELDGFLEDRDQGIQTRDDPLE